MNMAIVKFAISISLAIFFLVWIVNIYQRNVETENNDQQTDAAIINLEEQKQNIDKYGSRCPFGTLTHDNETGALLCIKRGR